MLLSSTTFLITGKKVKSNYGNKKKEISRRIEHLEFQPPFLCLRLGGFVDIVRKSFAYKMAESLFLDHRGGVFVWLDHAFVGICLCI